MPACSAVIGVIGVRGGIGLGVDGYGEALPGKEVVVCRAGDAPDIMTPCG